MDKESKSREILRFHCSKTGELVTTSECMDCSESQSCDYYATMLDEEHDR